MSLKLKVSLKLKCHWNCNVAKSEMQLKLKCNWNWNVTETEMSLKLKLKCHWNWNVTRNIVNNNILEWQLISERIYHHLGYVRNNIKTRATGAHFNLAEHGTKNMKFTILEQVRPNDPLNARERAKLLIRKFNTFYCRINKGT